MDRREFIKRILKISALGLFSNPFISQENLYSWGFAGTGIESWFYKKLKGGKVKCEICPHGCILDDSNYGLCKTRVNKSGKEINTAFENPCIIESVPIEMSPLYHFNPGSKAFSLTCGGCNLKCLYCQNWTISQLKPSQTRNIHIPVKKAVNLTKKENCSSVVFSYGEPICYLEYADKIARESANNNLKVNWVTSGFINKAPLRKIMKNVNAFTVTLKAFNDLTYRQLTGARIRPVLNTLKMIKENGNWLEIVNLIVPTYNDDLKRIKKMCLWIKKHLGTEVPVHFGRFYPKYKLTNLPPTPKKTVENARNTALEVGLKFVYISNISPHEGNNTYCPKCGKPIIKRLGFNVIKNNMIGNKCSFCGEKIPGIF